MSAINTWIPLRRTPSFYDASINTAPRASQMEMEVRPVLRVKQGTIVKKNVLNNVVGPILHHHFPSKQWKSAEKKTKEWLL